MCLHKIQFHRPRFKYIILFNQYHSRFSSVFYITTDTEQIQSLQATIMENKNELIDMRALLKDTKRQLTDQISKTNQLNLVLNRNICELNNKHEELKLLIEENNDYQRLVNDVSKCISAVAGDTVVEKIQNIVMKNNELSEENLQLLQQLDELGQIVEEIEAERLKNTDIEADILSFERQLSELSAHVSKESRLEPPSPNFSDIINELNKHLDKEINENAHLRTTVNELETKNHDLQEKIILLSDELKATNKLDVENHDLQSELNGLKEKLKMYKEKAKGFCCCYIL